MILSFPKLLHSSLSSPRLPALNMPTGRRKGRPSRGSLAPPPIPQEKGRWCWTCGRIMTPRKAHPESTSTPPKYCSDRCRRSKPSSHPLSIESQISQTFVQMLDSLQFHDGARSGKRTVLCGEVEGRVFGHPHTENTAGEGSASCSGSVDGRTSSGDEDEGNEGGVAVAVRDVGNGGEKGLTPQELGRRRAEEREKVRQAARRGVVLGFVVGEARGGEGGGEKGRECRRVEAVQGGRVVEASFAKGEWGVRWRDGGV